MKQLCLISTLQHNVGDDFVREGIVWLLRQVLGEVRCRVVHKHFPASVRGGFWEQLDRQSRSLASRPAWQQRLSRLADCGPLDAGTDAVLTADLVVQCGTPVYWRNAYSSCAQAEWIRPLIERRWRRVRDRVPLLNLGAGACQPLGSDGREIVEDANCRAFIDRFTAAAALTTVRDPLAQSVVRSCGHEVPLLPCPSIFAQRQAGIRPQPGEYVALNYMPSGGHYDPGGRDTAWQWEQTFKREALRIAARHPCLLVCHDRAELVEAERLLPQLPRFHSPRWQDYLEAYARCRWALVNRVHAAVVIGAFDRPAMLVGNDTRLLTAAAIPGLTPLPVSAAPAEVSAAVDRLLQGAEPPSNAGFLESAAAAYREHLERALAA